MIVRPPHGRAIPSGSAAWGVVFGAPSAPRLLRATAAMAPGAFTRSVGMRLAIVATAHLQARDLDHGLELGNRSVDILTRVQSSQTKDYVAGFGTALAPWRREPAVREFIHCTRTELGVAA